MSLQHGTKCWAEPIQLPAEHVTPRAHQPAPKGAELLNGKDRRQNGEEQKTMGTVYPEAWGGQEWDATNTKEIGHFIQVVSPASELQNLSKQRSKGRERAYNLVTDCPQICFTLKWP